LFRSIHWLTDIVIEKQILKALTELFKIISKIEIIEKFSKAHTPNVEPEASLNKYGEAAPIPILRI